MNSRQKKKFRDIHNFPDMIELPYCDYKICGGKDANGKYPICDIGKTIVIDLNDIRSIAPSTFQEEGDKVTLIVHRCGRQNHIYMPMKELLEKLRIHGFKYKTIK